MSQLDRFLERKRAGGPGPAVQGDQVDRFLARAKAERAPILRGSGMTIGQMLERGFQPQQGLPAGVYGEEVEQRQHAELVGDIERVKQLAPHITRKKGKGPFVWIRDLQKREIREPTLEEIFTLSDGMRLRQYLEPWEQELVTKAWDRWGKTEGQQAWEKTGFRATKAVPLQLYRLSEDWRNWADQYEAIHPATTRWPAFMREVARLPATYIAIGGLFKAISAVSPIAATALEKVPLLRRLAPASKTALARVTPRMLTELAQKHPITAQILAQGVKEVPKGAFVGGVVGTVSGAAAGLPPGEIALFAAESAAFFGAFSGLLGVVGGWQGARKHKTLQGLRVEYEKALAGNPDPVRLINSLYKSGKVAQSMGAKMPPGFFKTLKHYAKVAKDPGGLEMLRQWMRAKAPPGQPTLPRPAWATPEGVSTALARVGPEQAQALAAKGALTRQDMTSLGIAGRTSGAQRQEFLNLFKKELSRPAQQEPEGLKPAEIEQAKETGPKWSTPKPPSRPAPVVEEEPPGEPVAEPKVTSKRIQRLQQKRGELRLRIRELEGRQAEAEGPPTAAVELLRRQIAAFDAALGEVAEPPARYSRELAQMTPTQLAGSVRKLGKKTSPEERTLARRIRERQAEVKRLRAEVGKRPDFPAEETRVLDFVGKERRIAYGPGTDLGTEISEALQGAPASVKRYFRRVKSAKDLRPNEAADEVLDGLRREGLIAEDAGARELVAAVSAEVEGRGFDARLARMAQEEALQAEAAGVEGEAGEGFYMRAARQLEEGESIIEEAAEELRKARGQEVAISGMPQAEKAIKIIRRELATFERLAREATEAEAAEVAQGLERLRAEEAALELEMHEQQDLPELRRYIGKLVAVKGISKKAKREIVARYAPPGPKGGKVTSLRSVKERGVLLKILRSVERTRPKVIAGKHVITLKRERHIQQLRKNLLADGALTNEDFFGMLGELKITEPRFVNKTNFCTEQKAVLLIDRMIDRAPAIRHREQTAEALKGNEQLAEVVESDKTRAADIRRTVEEEGKKPKTNTWVDFRYYLANMDDATGAPFFDTGMDMLRAKREVELSVKKDFDRIAEAVGLDDYKAIAKDREALERVNDLIASKLKRAGRPARPENPTKAEVATAQAIEKVLHNQRNTVRWERFIAHRFKDRPIPDAPPADLTKATDIYESQGPEAARAFLDTCDWGVIKSGYEPESVVMPKIHHGPERPIRYGTRGIEVREAVFERQEKDILRRLSSYLYRRCNANILNPRIRTFVSVWDANADKFENPARVARELGLAISEVSGRPAGKHPLSRLLRRLYSHALLAKVLIDPAKSARNLHQTLAYYTDRLDLIHPSNRWLTDSERQYYEAHVSQLPGLRRDYFMEREKPLFGLRRWMDFVRRIAPYRWSDEYPRHWCFWAKLNRVARAMGKHPDNVKAMFDTAGIQELDARQVRAAAEILARDGAEAFRLFIAHEVTNNVHFAYGRHERALVEMGEVGTVQGNLLTFPRSYAQRLLKSTKKVYRGRNLNERWRGLKTVLSILAGGWLVGEGYKRIFGQRRNPYHPLQILNWSAGGLMTGALDIFSDLLWNTERVIMGDHRALDATFRSVLAMPSMFFPLYAEVLDGIEAVTDTRNLDVYALRKLREALSESYKPRSVKVRRTTVEKWQKILAGGADMPLSDIAEVATVNLAREHGIDLPLMYLQGKGTLAGKRVGMKDVRQEIQRQRRQEAVEAGILRGVRKEKKQ